MSSQIKQIGITTTIPIEILLAAGYTPVDLNNVFISDPDPGRLVNIAQRDGFPLNCCTWIKGIYGVCREYGISSVICCTSGDCSNTIMLMEVLRLRGLKVTAFAYPELPNRQQMAAALDRLAQNLGTTLEAASRIREELMPVRELALELDRLTWQQGLVSGWENHYWLVSSSDFNQDYHSYRLKLEELVAQCRRHQPYPQDMLRIAYIGVPPVYGRDLYHYLEKNRARVVFNEIQRQFTMPRPGDCLAQQYSNYTYPYSIHQRLDDITTELERRRVDAVIHYVQAFCHRAIGDIIFRDGLKLPMLTLEGNNDFFLSQQVRTRIEAFLDIIQRQRQRQKIPEVRANKFRLI